MNETTDTVIPLYTERGRMALIALEAWEYWDQQDAAGSSLDIDLRMIHMWSVK